MVAPAPQQPLHGRRDPAGRRFDAVIPEPIRVFHANTAVVYRYQQRPQDHRQVGKFVAQVRPGKLFHHIEAHACKLTPGVRAGGEFRQAPETSPDAGRRSLQQQHFACRVRNQGDGDPPHRFGLAWSGSG